MGIVHDKIFAGGGMDSDTALEGVQGSDYIHAEYARTVAMEGSDEGYLKPIEGNVLITNPRHKAGDEIINSKYFRETGTTFLFVQPTGSNLYRIEEFNPSDNSFTLILSGNNLFSGFVKDIKLVSKKMLIWNDASSEVKLINIDRAKNGEYLSFTQEDITLIKKLPLTDIEAKYISDETNQVNNLSGKLFQFRQQVIYQDNEASAYGPMSNRPIPYSEIVKEGVIQGNQNNSIVLKLTVDLNRVKKIITVAREAEGDWFIVERVNKEDIQSLPLGDEATPLQPKVYNPTTKTYSYIFNGQGGGEYVDILDTELLYDHVPREVRSVEVINKQIVALGGALREGYVRPKIKPNLISTGYEAIETPISDFSVVNVTTESGGTSATTRNKITFSGGSPKENDVFRITYQVGSSFAGSPEQIIYKDIEYKFTAQDETDPKDVVMARMVAELIAKYPIGYSSFFISQATINSSEPYILDIEVRRPVSGNNRTFKIFSAVTEREILDKGVVAIPSLKQSVKYTVALAHYDNFGRPFPIVTGPEFEITTKDLSELPPNYLPSIAWDLTGQTPPIGAKTYKWLLTKNNTYLNWVQGFAAQTNRIINDELVEFNISEIFDTSENIGAELLNYSFTKGDRAILRGSVEGRGEINFNLEIIEFKVEVDDTTEETEYYITVPKVEGFIPNTAGVIELSTPKTTLQTLDLEVFFEVGKMYNIIGGEYSVKTGEIREGDSYFRQRPSSGGFPIRVESPNFSFFYKSDYYSYGRPRVYYDTPEDIINLARIRYSREYVQNSRLNGITRFYTEDFIDYESIYGAIQYMVTRSNRLVVLQEMNIGYAGVYSNIIESAIGEPTVAISSKLLNNITYTQGKPTGIGKALKSFVEDNGTIYFIDKEKESVMRAGLDGVIDIGYNYSKKVNKYIREEAEEALTLLYDTKYNELHLLSRSTSDTLVFSEDLDKWVYNTKPIGTTQVTTSFNAKREYYTAYKGQLYHHTLQQERGLLYGQSRDSIIKYVVNENPDAVKTFNNVSIESDCGFDSPEEGIETQLGQTTEIQKEDFEIDYLNNQEGIYKTNFYRANPDPINGELLKGRYLLMTLKALPENSKKDFKLFKISVDYNVSPKYK